MAVATVVSPRTSPHSPTLLFVVMTIEVFRSDHRAHRASLLGEAHQPRGEPVTDTKINRHGDEIGGGQLWTDDPRRTVIRMRIDSLDDAGSLGAVAICTVVQAHDTDTGQVTSPGRADDMSRVGAVGEAEAELRCVSAACPHGSTSSVTTPQPPARRVHRPRLQHDSEPQRIVQVVREPRGAARRS